MKFVAMAAGGMLFLLGLHWIGQGTGWLVWPSDPDIDFHTGWAWFGVAAAAVGAGVVYRYSRL